MLKIAEYTQKALELRNRAIKAFNAAGLDIRINENEDTGLIHISLNISENWLLIKTKPVK